MSLDARAIALHGLGYAPRLVAVHGLSDYPSAGAGADPHELALLAAWSAAPDTEPDRRARDRARARRREEDAFMLAALL